MNESEFFYQCNLRLTFKFLFNVLLLISGYLVYSGSVLELAKGQAPTLQSVV
jgi:hypothetical protein